jgi:uncharacterized protein YxjI
MALTIREHIFSWKEKYGVYDEKEQPLYHVGGRFFSLGHELHITDMSGKEVAMVKQKVFAF